MQKIVFIINGGPVRDIGISGGEIHNIELINRIDKTKNDVFICCPAGYRIAQQIKGIKLLTYADIPFEEKTYKNLSILFFIYCYRTIASIFILRRLKPDVIIIGSHLFYDIIPIFFVGRKHIKCAAYVHHIIGEQKRKGLSFLITKFLERVSFYIMGKKDFTVLTYSIINKESLINKYGFKGGNIYMFQNGLDLNLINNAKGGKEPIYDICFCGRLTKTKGIFDLIKIIKTIKDYYPNILCAVIGSGAEKDNIIKTIKDNNLENNMQLLGYLGRRETMETMKSSKVFVLPSHEEGWGIVIGEAMACGLPVVVYKLKDIVEIWNNNVIWVECFNLNEFSDKIIKLLGNSKEREIYVQNGLKFAKILNWSNIIENEINIIMKSSS